MAELVAFDAWTENVAACNYDFSHSPLSRCVSRKDNIIAFRENGIVVCNGVLSPTSLLCPSNNRPNNSYKLFIARYFFRQIQGFSVVLFVI